MSTSHGGSRPLPLIHINAFPGTGKLTIARHLVASFQATTVKLVHNHLLINPADAVLHRDQPGYQNIRRQLRRSVFESIIDEPATHASAYVFTDFQASNELGRATCEEYAACATARGCDFIPITLLCQEDINLERLVATDRASHGKLIDIELVKAFRKNAELFVFERSDNSLALDVSQLSVEQASAKILDHILQVSPMMKDYVI